MKLNKIFQFATIAAATATLTGVTSCNYLDVVPAEQAGLSDAMKNHTNALGFLHSCYNAMTNREFSPRDYRGTLNCANDEFMIPEIWYSVDGQKAYQVMRNIQVTSGGDSFWDPYYNGIGQTLLFDRELDGEGAKNEVCVDQEEYKQWKAESRFCRAYYHFQLLRMFGPIPLTTSLLPMSANLGDYPGRTHFDGCVDWIVNELDECEKDLPEKRDAAELNRATKLICKAVKARLLLYAASDLYNGGFPNAYRTWAESGNKNWTSKNPVTGEDYGRALISTKFDPAKWQRALKACTEAREYAESLGYKLYTFDQVMGDSDVSYTDIRIPGMDEMATLLQGTQFVDEDGEMAEFDPEMFKKAVYTLRYLNATTFEEGNHELIWCNNYQVYGGAGNSGYSADSFYAAMLPRRVLQTTSNNKWCEGWNGVSPTLYTVEHFLAADGTLPGFNPNSKLYISSGQFHKENGGKFVEADKNLAKERERVTNICLNREPRFYAWIGFDGGDYLTNIKDGEPCVLNMRDPEQQGRGQGERNYAVCGFLSMKHVDPIFKYDGTNGNITYGLDSPDVVFRLAELILNEAECMAEMDKRGIAPAADDTYNAGKDLRKGAIAGVNRIRQRAYVAPLTEDKINIVEVPTAGGSEKQWDLVDWVRNERFIELWDEGHRYFDVRRWVKGEEYFGYGKRRGLNGLTVATKQLTASEFLTPMMISSQYTFHQRQYLYPIQVSQVYKNPQMVQNPGF